ncbi:MAG: hypothetical protein ABI411_06545 [Tahibacter sp.]
MSKSVPMVFVAFASLLLCACSPSAPTPPAADAQAVARARNEAQITQNLTLYEDLRGKQRYDLAADIGADIVAKAPGSAAAQQVQRTLAEVRKQVQAQQEARRIAQLWTYNVVPEGKGKQYSAYVHLRGGPTTQGAGRARLVLRQHPAWGQSVYLLRDEGGFACGKPCSVNVRFDDGAAQRMPATIPPTGEPALFIDEDVAFISKLAKSRLVSIEVDWKGQGKRTLGFEVAGIDLARLPMAPGKK